MLTIAATLMVKILDYPVSQLLARTISFLTGKGFNLNSVNFPHGICSKLSPTFSVIFKFFFRHKKFFKSFLLQRAIESHKIPDIFIPILQQLNATTPSEFQSHLSQLHLLSVSLTESTLAFRSNIMDESALSRGSPGVRTSTLLKDRAPSGTGRMTMSRIAEQETMV